MDPRLFILTTVDAALDREKLDDISDPTWNDGQLVHQCRLRLSIGDESAWSDFISALDSSREFAGAIQSILLKESIALELPHSDEFKLDLPQHVFPLTKEDETRLVRHLRVCDCGDKWFAHKTAGYFPDRTSSYFIDDKNRFMAPAKKTAGELMYIEMKPGLSGPARIGRVRFSKTRKTLYYGDVVLQSLKGQGYKANFYDVESGMHYWVSKCRKDGNDALYPATIEIDEDAREEYWVEIRKQPDNRNVASFKSIGKYSKRRPD